MEHTFLIAGGSGLIGTELREYFNAVGYKVRILSRRATNATLGIYNWNLKNEYIDPLAFDGVSVVINLAGQSIIGKRWTDQRKEELRNSRIQSTKLLVSNINNYFNSVQHFVQASAIGYFGNRGDEVLTEDSTAGEGFMAELCKDWEAEALKINKPTNVSVVRIGLYLSTKGGVFATLSKLSRFMLASAFGNGKQFTSYTHHKEFSSFIHNIITHKYESGIYNAVGKKALSLSELVNGIAKNNSRSVLLPNIPAFILKLILGESSAALLYSTRVQSAKLEKLKFHKYDTLKEALEDL